MKTTLDDYELIHCPDCDGTCLPEEPDCVDGRDHEWTTDSEGGCDDNPGCQSYGGTAYSFSEHCCSCGLHREVITAGSQRDLDECDSVTYTDGIPDPEETTEDP
jgi:hypothetical protein